MPNIIDTGTDKLIASIDGAIGRIIFNKPDKHNAVCMQMWKALGSTIEYFGNNDSIRVIILSGSGERSFVSGADISEFDQSRSTNEDVTKYDEVAEGATQKIYESSKPTLAMIQGYCIGGGLGIAVACDIRIASENSTFAIPAAKLGLGYRSRNLERVINLVGPSFAREILITARQFNVKEAVEMGLVNRVIKPLELRSYCENYANIIASNAVSLAYLSTNLLAAGYIAAISAGIEFAIKLIELRNDENKPEFKDKLQNYFSHFTFNYRYSYFIWSNQNLWSAICLFTIWYYSRKYNDHECIFCYSS